MKVWEVVRNFNKNFTDDFKKVYGSPQDYASEIINHIPISRKGVTEQELWKSDTKNVKKVK